MINKKGKKKRHCAKKRKERRAEKKKKEANKKEKEKMKRKKSARAKGAKDSKDKKRIHRWRRKFLYIYLSILFSDDCEIIDGKFTFRGKVVGGNTCVRQT